MRPRPKGPQFPPEDLHAMLLAFGDPSTLTGAPLPATISTLDSIVTDFVIESCHEAAAHATAASRAKVKQDDFQWALRRDARKLGRVQELLELDRELKMKRRMVEMDEGEVLKREARDDAAAAAEGGAKVKRRRKAATATATAPAEEAGSEKSAGAGSRRGRKGKGKGDGKEAGEGVRQSIEADAAAAAGSNGVEASLEDVDVEAEMPDALEPDLGELFGE